MKVYILTHTYHYEEMSIFGVFSSFNSAEKALKEHIEHRDNYVYKDDSGLAEGDGEYFYIEEVEVQE